MGRRWGKRVIPPADSTRHMEMIANVNRLILAASNVAASQSADGGGSAIVHFEDYAFPNSQPDSFRHIGSFLARVGKEDAILCADVDTDNARRCRKTWLRRWLNRRPETYGRLVEVGNH